MIGFKTGMLTVFEFSHMGKNQNKHWKARCECGNIRIIATADLNKKNCPKPSCGCYRTIKDPKERFSKFVEKTESCWSWKGTIFPSGYGEFWFRNKNMTSHRASYLLFKGEIPENICVCHICDNPSCVNPDHLFLGTSKENTHDMIRKGRKKVNIKITESQKNEIYELHLKNIPQREIAKIFNVKQSSIGKIIRKKFPTRSMIGEDNNKAILTSEKVKKIRQMYAEESLNFCEIARIYSVNPTTIERIIKGQTWKHVK